MKTPDLSVVILSWNTEDLTRACLTALRRCVAASPLAHEILVIDNASHDGSVAMIAREFPEVALYRNGANLGYAGGVNQGLRLARGRNTVLLGSDTEVRPGTLEKMARFLEERPRCGAVAPRLVNPDGSLQRSCMRFPDLETAVFYDTFLERWFPEHPVLRRYFYKEWDHARTRRVDQPPGTCLMVRREVVDAVGPMDRKLWLLFNDVDWCKRIRDAGWEIWFLDEGTEVLHHKGASTGRFRAFPVEWHKNRLWYYKKHYHVMGAAIVKLALLYVGIRELVRIRRNLESTREFLSHASQIVRSMSAVLFM